MTTTTSRPRTRSGRGSFGWWLGLLTTATLFIGVGTTDGVVSHVLGGVGLLLAISVTIVHGHWVVGSQSRTDARIITAVLLSGLLAVIAVVLDQIAQPLSGPQLSVGLLLVCWALAGVGIGRKHPGRATAHSTRPGGSARTWPWWTAVCLAAALLTGALYAAWRTEVTDLTPTRPILASPELGAVQVINPTSKPLRVRLVLPEGPRTLTVQAGETQTIRTTQQVGAVATLTDLSSRDATPLTVTIGSGGA